jgi:PAT family beta-lactamase induction signal transducer AmpG
VSLRRKLAIIALVYVIEGFPMGLYQGLLPAYFTSFVDLEGDLPIFGWLSFLYVAWSAKVLWSPLVDRFGERRQWIAGAMITMTLCCVGIANADPAPLGVFLWGCVVLYCLASATQDVAIDAYSIGLVDRGEEGPFNSMKATAYRVGMLTSGSCLLLLPRWIGWDGTFAAAALLSAAFAASVRLAPPVPVPLESRRATIEPLRRWLSQTSVLPVFFFVLLYRVGDRAMAPMVMPFWRARGLAYEEIAAINAFFGVGATILGAVSFTAGLAGAAFLSYLMRICEKEHAAVQYALLTAIYALSGAIIALPSGWLTERMGYAAYFALTAALALPAFAFLPRARAWIGEDRPYFRS